MSLLGLILICVAIGVGLWALNQYVPLDPTVKKILNIVVILVLVLIVLSAFGVFDILRGVRVPHL